MSQWGGVQVGKPASSGELERIYWLFGSLTILTSTLEFHLEGVFFTGSFIPPSKPHGPSFLLTMSSMDPLHWPQPGWVQFHLLVSWSPWSAGDHTPAKISVLHLDSTSAISGCVWVGLEWTIEDILHKSLSKNHPFSQKKLSFGKMKHYTNSITSSFAKLKPDTLLRANRKKYLFSW